MAHSSIFMTENDSTDKQVRDLVSPLRADKVENWEDDMEVRSMPLLRLHQCKGYPPAARATCNKPQGTAQSRTEPRSRCTGVGEVCSESGAAALRNGTIRLTSVAYYLPSSGNSIVIIEQRGFNRARGAGGAVNFGKRYSASLPAPLDCCRLQLTAGRRNVAVLARGSCTENSRDQVGAQPRPGHCLMNRNLHDGRRPAVQARTRTCAALKPHDAQSRSPLTSWLLHGQPLPEGSKAWPAFSDLASKK
ncbi:hypothetical protein CC80DRAFT_537616 [Byssothecium circinans]|uniref:Uncharacterized protein n=1 Tax=Byssothecium circinans TaxID=147558 RepID=A0A6A5TL13_9PLEO|nr:hypothetical protein CC80DRAFT_537616 [Byssothecium circinans]